MTKTRKRCLPRACEGGVHNRKQIHWKRTLENYKNRISRYPKDVFADLEGAYVSDFMQLRRGSAATNSLHASQISPHIPILMDVCSSKGIQLLGWIAENRKCDAYVHLPVQFPSNAEQRVVYVGQANYLTGHKETTFSVLGYDKVFFT